MTSSTSSSRAYARGTLAILVGLLLALEVVTRAKLFHLSADFRAYRAYPARAVALARSEGARIAVLGNSVAHEGVDPAILADAVRGGNASAVHADIFSVDHSYINTWYFVLKRYFWRPGNRVDLVLVPFWGDNLYDGNQLEAGRLAQFFTALEDWPEVLRTDLRTTPERAEFVVSGLWATYAARDRMQQWVFTRLLPGYRQFATLEQEVTTNHQMLVAASRPRRARPAHALQRFLRSARQHRTRVCFVAVPTLHSEWTDPYAPLVRLIERAGMHYLDLRRMTEVNAQSYVDRVHMNAGGRAVFSRRLGEAIAPLVRCEGAACTVGAQAVPPAAPTVAVAGSAS